MDNFFFFPIFFFSGFFCFKLASSFFSHPLRVYQDGKKRGLSQKQLAELFIRASGWAVPFGTFIELFWACLIGLIAKLDQKSYDPDGVILLLFVVMCFGVIVGVNQFLTYLDLLKGKRL